MGSMHEKLKQKLAGARQQYGWSPKDGDNKVFILPPGSQYVDNLDAVETLAYQFKGHYFRIEGRQGEASLCLAELKNGTRCPACATWRAFKDSADPALQEMAKNIRATDSYIFNMIDLGDTGKGVQRWSANWTCWTKIMEIASNPAWGYVFDPKNGVPFLVTKTPKGKSRTSWPSYSVMPEPGRVDVSAVLAAAPDGPAALDNMEEARMEEKTGEEIQALLTEMGFPVVGGPAQAPPAQAIATPVGVRPVAVSATPTPPSPAPTSIAPTPIVVSPPASAAAPVPTPLVPNTASVTQAVAPHYDPGPEYKPVVPIEQHPVGAPRCFGGYSPRVHRCQPCPVLAACQHKMLGIP